MTASLCSLKGPRHGGANAKVVQMMADLRSRVQDPADPEQVRQYLSAMRALGFSQDEAAGLAAGMKEKEPNKEEN